MNSILFHQFQRYKLAQMLLNSMRINTTHTILEVGAGNHSNLEKFLPNDDIKYLDINLSEENIKNPKFILGDITEINLGEDSFDFIIALDVLEHIPTNKRDEFFSAISKAVKYGVIISVPTEHLENIYNDKLLEAIFMGIGSKPPVWIREHEVHGLPKEDYITSELEKRFGHECNVIYHSSRELFSLMIQLEALASNSTILYNLFNILNDYYNDFIFYNDLSECSEEAAKTYYVCCKELDLQKRAELKDISKNDFFVQQNISRIDRLINWFGLYDFEKKETQKLFNIAELKASEIDRRLYDIAELKTSDINKKIQKSIGMIDNLSCKLTEDRELSIKSRDRVLDMLSSIEKDIDFQINELRKEIQETSSILDNFNINILNTINNFQTTIVSKIQGLELEVSMLTNKLVQLEQEINGVKATLSNTIFNTFVRNLKKIFNK